jgi:uncharacterized protein YeaO (DUF488 family)
MIKVKRVYERAADNDGDRFLVDRVWPRGLEGQLALDGRIPEVAPTDRLRKRFARDPRKWTELAAAISPNSGASPKVGRPLR